MNTYVNDSFTDIKRTDLQTKYYIFMQKPRTFKETQLFWRKNSKIHAKIRSIDDLGLVIIDFDKNISL